MAEATALVVLVAVVAAVTLTRLIPAALTAWADVLSQLQ